MSDDKKVVNQEVNEIVELSDDALEVVAGGAGKLAGNAPIQRTSNY